MELAIILERTRINPPTLRYCLRAVVPEVRWPFFADATKVSAYKNATAEDIAALRAGQIVEFVSEMDVGELTGLQVRTTLEATQAKFQLRVTADAEHNPYRFYGTSWNGTTWTIKGVS